MSHPVVEKYRSLVTMNDDGIVNKMLGILVEVPKDRLEQFYAGSTNGGRLYVYRNAEVCDGVVEYIPDHANETSVTTLYREHPMFESRAKLIATREEVISAIDRVLMALPGTTTIYDEGRNKELYLAELGTAQLLDVLKHFSS